MIETFRSSELAIVDGREAWQELVSRAFVPFEVVATGTDGFRAEARRVSYGLWEATDMRAQGHVVRRTSKQIDASAHDYYKVGLQLRGHCVISQANREAALTPGDFVIYDCARPAQLAFDDPMHMLAFMFPRPQLRLSPHAVDRVLVQRISGHTGMGALVAPLLVSLFEHADEMPAAAAQHITDGVLDLLTAICVERSGELPASPDPLRRSLLLKTKAFIETRLDDPELSPTTIAAAHHVSIRYLYKLYESEPVSVSQYIRTRRLEHCRRDLVDPSLAGSPISAIAARWGFTDPAHFSSAFRAAHGCSPSDYRAGTAD